MRSSDFFRDEIGQSPWGDGVSTTMLDIDLVRSLREHPVEEHADASAGLGLVDLAQEELTSFGTGGGERLDDREIEEVLRTIEALTTRLAVPIEVPFRNFTTFKAYWLRNDGYGSWQARRDMVEELFGPTRLRLIRLEEAAGVPLARPVSPRSETGWPTVDDEIGELRRRFDSSTTPQDYRAVGTYCMGVIEALSRTVYDAARHLRPGEAEPPVDKSKQRLERYIEDALPGKPNEELRGLARRVIALAHQVKHSETPTRTEAGIAADSVILLANMLRRLAER